MNRENEVVIAVLGVLEHGAATSAEIASALDRNPRSISVAMTRMYRAGIVDRVRKLRMGQGRPAYVYWKAPE